MVLPKVPTKSQGHLRRPEYHINSEIKFVMKVLLTSVKLRGSSNMVRILSWHIWHVHDDVIKWKHFPRNWPFVQGIHLSTVNSPHKGQWRGALMFCLICVRINDWVNNREAADLRFYRAHYDVIVMTCPIFMAVLQELSYPYPALLTHLSLDKLAAILADNNFKCIVLNENDRILILISLTFVPRSPIDNKYLFR